MNQGFTVSCNFRISSKYTPEIPPSVGLSQHGSAISSLTVAVALHYTEFQAIPPQFQ